MIAPASSLVNFQSTTWGCGDQAEPGGFSYLRKDLGGHGSQNLGVLRGQYTEGRSIERQGERRDTEIYKGSPSSVQLKAN